MTKIEGPWFERMPSSIEGKRGYNSGPHYAQGEYSKVAHRDVPVVQLKNGEKDKQVHLLNALGNKQEYLLHALSGKGWLHHTIAPRNTHSANLHGCKFYLILLYPP
jgi:hypothetical protein